MFDAALDRWWSQCIPGCSQPSLSGGTGAASSNLDDASPLVWSCVWNSCGSAATVVLSASRIVVVDRALAMLPVVNSTTTATVGPALSRHRAAAALSTWLPRVPFDAPVAVSGASLPAVTKPTEPSSSSSSSSTHAPPRHGSSSPMNTSLPSSSSQAFVFPPPTASSSTSPDVHWTYLSHCLNAASHLSKEPHSSAVFCPATSAADRDRMALSPSLFGAWEPALDAQPLDRQPSAAPAVVPTPSVDGAGALAGVTRPPAIVTAPVRDGGGGGGGGGHDWAVQASKCVVVSASGAVAVCAVDTRASKGAGLCAAALVQQHLSTHRVLDAVKVSAA